MRHLLIYVFILLLLIGNASAVTDVTLVVPTHRINEGDTFDIKVIADPKGDVVAGWQLNFLYNSSLLKVNYVSEGNFLKQYGANTFFNAGVIDNQTGTVKNIFSTILGRYNVSTPGTFVIFNVTAIGTGTSNIDLSNVKISSPEGQSVPLSTFNQSISSYSISDINGDWTTDIMDIVSASQHFGETTYYPYASYDANRDGIVDIFDIIIVARNIT